VASYGSLFVGDPAPWFRQRCTTAHGDYTFDMSGGRYVVLYFYGSSQAALSLEALKVIRDRKDVFDDKEASFFGVSADANDETRLQAELPGIRHFFDHDGLVGQLFGARPVEASSGESRSLWYVLDPLLRIRAVVADEAGIAEKIVDITCRMRRSDDAAIESPSPVLMLREVFEPEFCSRLIAYYNSSESRVSGVFTQKGDGVSLAVTDTGFKRRRDCNILDRTLVGQIQARIIRRVVPEIKKVFQFEASQMERLILAAYESSDRGCFGAHRDNTVKATEHRRFAISINLNDSFEGGELVFPEFSQRRYRPPSGGALVFSCSLMHLVTPVTAGQRLACLPFVYDEAGALLKRANAASAREASMQMPV
jgi:predicted 2-oxoglutarate/Fe(II)-dependent dioxygenase YbiX/peroxiredoxin